MKLRKKNKRNIFLNITGILFFGLVAFLVLGNIFHKDRSFSETENRMLASAPEVTVDSLLSGQFETNYESYINDQFVFRDAWVHLKGLADTISGKQDSNGVFRGKKGYLMENFVEPDPANLEKVQTAINSFSQKYPDLKQYFLLAPTAVNILEDYLPAGAPAGDQNAWMDQMYSFFAENGVTGIDVRERFKAQHEKGTKLYYQTDHHWTTRGAYEAFSEAAVAMGLVETAPAYNGMVVSNQFRGTLSAKSGFRMNQEEEIEVQLPDEDQPGSIVTYVSEQEKSGSFYNAENLEIRDAYTVFLDGNHPEVKVETPLEGGRKLLLLKDSYANCFLPFLAPYYREIIVIDPRYYYDDLSMLVDAEGITDVLYLYNANTFFQDTSLAPVLEAAASSGTDESADGDQNSTGQTGGGAQDNTTSADQGGAQNTTTSGDQGDGGAQDNADSQDQGEDAGQDSPDQAGDDT